MIFNDEIGLDTSSISTLLMREEFRSVNLEGKHATFLEEYFDVICEQQGPFELRFSFSGDETEIDILAAISGLEKLIESAAG